MDGILKYIKLGTNAKEWFNYDGEPLPIRPLSTYELDTILEKIIREGITQKTFSSIYKIKHNLIDKENVVITTKEDYLEFFHYLNEIDYWTVYFAMKDFQDEKFSQPDLDGEFRDKFKKWNELYPKGYYIVKKMKYVHRIAEDIQYMTSQPLIKLRQVLQNKDGRILASTVHTYHIPLTNEAWKLTPLQETFLRYSDPDAPIIIEDESELPGIKAGSLKDIAMQLNAIKGI